MKEDKKNISVIYNENEIGKTYEKRAKGLVKKEKANYTDDKTIEILFP